VLYLRHVDDYYRDRDGRPTSEVRIVHSAVRSLRRLFGATPAAEFGPQRFKAVRKAYIDAGVCRFTANVYANRVACLSAGTSSTNTSPQR
jgi:hypothetical protein